MRTIYVTRGLALCVVLELGALCLHADSPSITKLAFVGSNYVFVGFSPATTNWVALDGSGDLRTWNEVADVASTNTQTFFIEQMASLPQCRFYRLRRPGTTVDDARAKWPANTNLSYQFELTSVEYQGSVLTATVTVTAGRKSITNAQADGQPLAQPDPASFPSVEELFVALSSAQQAGCRQVWAVYDPKLGYPANCFIDQRVSAPPPGAGQSFHYIISRLSVNGN